MYGSSDRDGGLVRRLLEAGEEKRAKVAEFVSPDGQQQWLSRLDDAEAVAGLAKAFADKTIYIADGHHRSASAARASHAAATFPATASHTPRLISASRP